MLRRLRLKNFYSIKEELEVSLLLNAKTPVDFRSMPTLDEKKASKVLAFVGANASGKTNILKSLAFLDWFVGDSFMRLGPDEEIPVSPHFSNPHEPVEMEAEFEIDENIWEYRLVLTKQQVLHESLYRKGYRFVYVFKRDWDEAGQKYQIKLKEEDFDFDKKEAEKVRKNASLIATAAQYNQPLALRFSRLNIETNLTMLGKYNFNASTQLVNAAVLFHQQKEIKDQMSRLLSQWDLGLSGVTIKEHKVTDADGKKETIYLPFGRHRIAGKDYELILWEESGGTKSAFVLLGKVLPILKVGGLAVIDELESDLHPHMLAAILELFFSPITNPYNAQIIFSTHSHEILNMLHKEQIILVEKNKDLNTDAWRLDDIEGVRSDDNFYAKYMAGAYGGVPEI